MSADRGLFWSPTWSDVEEICLRAERQRAAERELSLRALRALRRADKLWKERAAQERAAEERAAKEAAERERAAQEAARERAAERQLKRGGPAKERRSRIDWNDLIGEPDIVKRQEGFERGATALAMRAAGLTYAQVGERLGVTADRARQIANKAERQRKHPGHKGSPVEAMQRADVNVLLDEQDYSPREKARLAASLRAFAYPAKRDWLLVGSGRAA